MSLGEGHGAHGDAILPLPRLTLLALALPQRVLQCERRRADHLGLLFFLLHAAAGADAVGAGEDVLLRGGEMVAVRARHLQDP